MEELKDRIAKIVKSSGGPKKFAEKVGISTAQVDRYVKGRNTPGLDVAAKIAELAGVTIDWLMYGRDVYHLKHPEFETRLNELSAAVEYHVDDQEEQGLFMACMNGEEMSPTLFDGEIFVVDTKQADPRVDGSGVYIFNWKNSQKIRRLSMLSNEIVEIICDNPVYPSQQDHLSSLGIIGRARPKRHI
jgi:transcriptional regulator with XRE-family HTH domain